MMPAKPTVQLNLRIPLELKEQLELARAVPKTESGWQPPPRKLSAVVIDALERAVQPPAPEVTRPRPRLRLRSTRKAARPEKAARKVRTAKRRARR